MIRIIRGKPTTIRCHRRVQREPSSQYQWYREQRRSESFGGSVSKGVDYFLRELDRAIDIGTKYLKQIGKWMEEAVGASVVDVCGKVVEIGEEIGEVLVSFLAGMLMGIDNAFAIPTDVSDEIFSEHADAYNLGKILGRSGIIAVLSIMAGMFVGGVGAAAGATIVIGGAAVLVTTSAIAITWNELTQGHLTLAVSNEGSSSGKENTSGEGKGDSETVTSNKGNVYDNTPSSNHSTTRGNPIKGEPNSSVDILDKNGNVVRRRWFDSEGNAMRDLDYTNHGNPKTHPEWPHEHIWEGGRSPYGG